MTFPVFAHVGITCKDPVKVERFYTKYFGFKRARVIPMGGAGQIVFIKSKRAYLELFRAEEESPIPPTGGDGPRYPGLRHLSFEVDNVDAKLAEMGKDAMVTQGPLDFYDIVPGWRVVWVADPEGNIVEISQGYQDA